MQALTVSYVTPRILVTVVVVVIVVVIVLGERGVIV